MKSTGRWQVGQLTVRAEGFATANSEITQRHFERDVAFKGARTKVAILTGEPQPQHVAVGAEFRDGIALIRNPNLEQLVGLAPQLLLIAPGLSDCLRGLSAVAQQAQRDPQRIAQRAQREKPLRQILQASVRGAVAPSMIRGHVKLIGATWDIGPATDLHEPLVFAQMLACFADGLAQGGDRLFDLGKDARQSFKRDPWLVAKADHGLALALEFLQQVGLDIRAGSNLEDVEERQQRDMMVERIWPRNKVLEFSEQILESK